MTRVKREAHVANDMIPRQRVNQAHDAAPTPERFYIHDDLTAYVVQTQPPMSPALSLTQELFHVLRRNAPRVIILHLEDQLRRLAEQVPPTPFAVTIGIGRAGERVAQQVHARTGWFPSIRRVDVTREENDAGGYRLVSTTSEPFEAQLPGLDTASSLAIVDDTVFSGFTMLTILQALAPHVRARTHAFCLRGVAESLPRIRDLCPLCIGFAAAGRLFEEVSFINASGLVLRVGIRRAGRRPMAFFERRSWMEAWFPGHADDVIEVCRRLNRLLESSAPQNPDSP